MGETDLSDLAQHPHETDFLWLRSGSEPENVTPTRLACLTWGNTSHKNQSAHHFRCPFRTNLAKSCAIATHPIRPTKQLFQCQQHVSEENPLRWVPHQAYILYSGTKAPRQSNRIKNISTFRFRLSTGLHFLLWRKAIP